MEYISREEIEKAKDETIYGKCVPDVWFSAFVKKIDAIPAADVAPVRRGKWKTVMCDDGYGEYTLFECDQCGSQSAQKRNYCSNCGAKME